MIQRPHQNCQTLPYRLHDRQLDAAFDDAHGDGIAGEAGGVVNIEFLHQVVPMLLDRLDADAEVIRDLLVGSRSRV
jgi:hypothetical protein